MNRRSFLKALGIGGAAAVVAPKIAEATEPSLAEVNGAVDAEVAAIKGELWINGGLVAMAATPYTITTTITTDTVWVPWDGNRGNWSYT